MDNEPSFLSRIGFFLSGRSNPKAVERQKVLDFSEELRTALPMSVVDVDLCQFRSYRWTLADEYLIFATKLIPEFSDRTNVLTALPLSVIDSLQDPPFMPEGWEEPSYMSNFHLIPGMAERLRILSLCFRYEFKGPIKGFGVEPKEKPNK